MAGLTDPQPPGDGGPGFGHPHAAGTRAVPNAALSNEWASIVLPAAMKVRLLRSGIAGVRLRRGGPVSQAAIARSAAVRRSARGQGRSGQSLVLRLLNGPRQWAGVITHARRRDSSWTVPAGPGCSPRHSVHALRAADDCRATVIRLQAEPKGAGYLCVR